MRAILLAAALAVTASSAFAQVSVENPWVRATVGAGKVTAGYGVIVNTGAYADKLLGVSTPGAAGVEIHESKDDNGVMMMEEVGALDIPAQGRVSLEPKGYHLMILKVTQPLKVGDTLPLVFTFERQGAVNVSATVMPLSAQSGPE